MSAYQCSRQMQFFAMTALYVRPPEFTTEPKRKGVSNKLLDTPLIPQADYLFKKMLTVTGSSPSDTLWR